MKKRFTLTVVLVVCLPILALAQRHKPIARHAIFLGAATTPALQMKGFENFDISDWQEYGLKSRDAQSAEGRVRVPLKDRTRSGPAYGLSATYRYTLSNALFATATLPLTFSGNVFRAGLQPGITCNFIRKVNKDKAFNVGISPAIGLDLVSIGFGEIKQLPGYTSPVIVKQGVFSDGHTLRVNTVGFSYQAGLSLEYAVNQKLSFVMQGGYGGTLFGKLNIQVEDDEASTATTQNREETERVVIKLDDAAVVKPDFSATPANINPAVSAKGLYGTVAVGFKF